MRIQKRLQPDLTFDEFMHFEMEHRIKELEQNRMFARTKTDKKTEKE